MLILVTDLFFDFQDCQMCSFSLAVWFSVAETGSHRSACDPLGSSHRLHAKCWNTDVGMHIFSSSGSGCLFVCFVSCLSYYSPPVDTAFWFSVLIPVLPQESF